MKVKTKDLTGAALKWAALTCEGWTDLRSNTNRSDNALVMTTPWGGISCFFTLHELDVLGIIGRERISITHSKGLVSAHGYAEDGLMWTLTGGAVEEAVLRCYVASRLGDEVEVPDVLAEGKP